MARPKKKTRDGEARRDVQLSGRLDSLLDAIFSDPPDPNSLYWDIAAQLQPEERIPAQKKIRKVLRQREDIGAEAAILAGCVLNLTGFPAHRVLHFLSVYIHGGLPLSLFEFAVGTIFLGEPPIPSSMVYDMTQYTYLEKRTLARKSLEITDRLKETLSSELLLFLYLLSLRDDLSNENVQLIALVMKNCFPTNEVRTRLGGASLEEFGEIARAWKRAEERTLAGEQAQGSVAQTKPKRAFDRDTASFFLDKYFSDSALEEMQAKAPPPLPLPMPKRRETHPEEEPSAYAAAALPSLAVEAAPSKAARGERASTGGSTPGGGEPGPDVDVFTAPRGKPARPLQSGSRRPPPASATEATPRPEVSLSPVHAASADRAFSPLRQTTARGSGAKPKVSPRADAPQPRPALRTSGSLAPRRQAARAPAALRSAAAHAAPRSSGGSPRASGRSGDSLRAVGTSLLRWLRSAVVNPFILPFVAAVFVVGVAMGVAAYVVPSPMSAPPTPAMTAQPTASTASPASASPTTPTQGSPAQSSSEESSTTYLVQEGDSLWKIFLSLRSPHGGGTSWLDFLSTTKRLNNLSDPDRIHKGKVLTLSPPRQ